MRRRALNSFSFICIAPNHNKSPFIYLFIFESWLSFVLFYVKHIPDCFNNVETVASEVHGFNIIEFLTGGAPLCVCLSDMLLVHC